MVGYKVNVPAQRRILN